MAEDVAQNRRGLSCPHCGKHTRVLRITQRDDRSETVRRRACTACGHRFNTEEKIVPAGLDAVDGGRQSSSTP